MRYRADGDDGPNPGFGGRKSDNSDGGFAGAPDEPEPSLSVRLHQGRNRKLHSGIHDPMHPGDVASRAGSCDRNRPESDK